MDEESSRCLRWKRFLGLISLDTTSWIEDAQLRRGYYNDILEMYKDAQLPSHAAAALEADMEALPGIIPNQVSRREKFVRVVRSVLKHWALVHDDTSYKHGMHVLAGVIVFVMMSEENPGSQSPRKPAKPAKPAATAFPPKPPTPMHASTTAVHVPPRPPPPPPRNTSRTGTAEYQYVMNPSYAEHDTFYMFSRLMEYLERMYVSPANTSPRFGQDSTPSPIERLSNTVQRTILPAINPTMVDQLRQLNVRPTEYTMKWVTTLFASVLPLDKALAIWDHLLLGVAQSPSNESRTAGLPMLSVLCTSLLISLESEVLARRNKRDCVEFLLSVHRGVDPGMLVQQARCLQDPFHVATMAPNIEVVEFTDGPLGMALAKSDDTFQVSSCNPGGQAERSGQVQIGDEIFAVNGVKPPAVTWQQMVDRISRIGRPLYIAFQHADNRMSLNFNGFNNPLPLPSRPAPPPPPPRSPTASSQSRRVTSPEPPLRLQQPSLGSSTLQSQAGTGRGGVLSLRAADGFSPKVIAGEQAQSMVPLTLEDAVFQAGSGILIKVEINGVLFVTNYRLIFHRFSKSSQESGGIYWQIPIHMVWKVDCSTKDSIFGFGGTEKSITVCCKNGQLRKFNAQPQMESALLETNRTMSAIVHQPDITFPYLHCSVKKSEGRDVCAKFSYDLHAEYSRVGLLRYAGTKLIDQRQLPICATYPRQIVVPAALSVEDLQKVASYRSKQRIPAIVWHDPETHAVISRSAQPLVGIKSHRSTDDERYLSLLRVLGGKSKFYIIDARSRVATIGNKAIGKGTEMIKYYPNVELLFMDIGNIHSVRESESSLHTLFRPWALQSGGTFTNKLEQTGWLSHIYAIMSAAVRVVDIVRNQGCSCLVHCSDGWDRTAQITSLSMLLLDPFHRSFAGFFTLIEKEWLDFGHKFHDRSAHGTLNADDERSPIFVLWLDCVWQLVRQFPSWFEFNERFLLFLADNVYSCRFGTFLYNTHNERREHDVRDRTISIWAHVEENLQLYQNSSYASVERVLIPSCNTKNIVLWEAYFCRFDPSLIPAHPSICDYV